VKRLSPAAISTLKEALASIFWYKRDLRSFLRIACGEEAQGLVAQLDWEQTKLHVVADLVDTMARQESRYQEGLIRLMLAVCDFSDFSHLRRLEDGEPKARRAESAVNAVRAQTATYRDQIEERERAEKLRELARAEAQAKRLFQEALEKLRAKYLALVQHEYTTPQERGLDFEQLLRELFELFDLDPRGPFRTTADQVDGAFTFEGGDYLLSARWRRDPVGLEDLDAFKGKVQTRLENTLGLYVSVTGFSSTAIERHNAAQPVLILMDGTDLMTVLENRIGLDDLLLRKRRHAAQTGEVFLPVSQVLA